MAVLGPLFNYERGTEILMCKNLMVPDPYELNTVVVYKSKMQGGGEGLFAKVDLPAHRIVAFYNGIHEQIDDDDDTVRKCFFHVMIFDWKSLSI